MTVDDMPAAGGEDRLLPSAECSEVREFWSEEDIDTWWAERFATEIENRMALALSMVRDFASQYVKRDVMDAAYRAAMTATFSTHWMRQDPDNEEMMLRCDADHPEAGAFTCATLSDEGLELIEAVA